MIDQPQLFDWTPPAPHPPYNGEPPCVATSPTSREAATRIRKAIGPLHEKVLAYLNANPSGATDEELIEALSASKPNTIRPRRIELTAIGKVKDSGTTRQTHSGRRAVVWVVT